MNWSLPTSVEIDGECHKIRNDCDFRVVLDVICALKDDELSNSDKIRCALYIFYEDLSKIKNIEQASKEMFFIINCGQVNDGGDQNKPVLMDWEHDFRYIAPPVSRVLGYDPRDERKFTHWYSFVGAYQEIGECTFSNIVSIRSKKAKNQKLEKWEEQFYRENREMIDLPQRLSEEEKMLLDSEW